MKQYVDSTVSAGVAITIPPLHQLLVYVTDALLQMAASSFAESSTQRSRDRPIPSASATPGRYLSRTLFCIKSANARVEAVNATVLKRRTSVTLSEGCQFVVSPAQTEGQQRETEKKETRPAREHIPGHQFVQLVLNNKKRHTSVIRPLHLRISCRRPARGGTGHRMAPARTALRIRALCRACMALHERIPTN
ncbi:Hypothetical_protein [Hexamita inflata]|uniref:Hypothetical_protein n=1 Tax=Hexamita inflata TaxID=28002 RepID=A0AA86UZL8_9EUKA|nr:Hypothetical protein HINF_LOCUS66240 [Hexamita inflata]